LLVGSSKRDPWRQPADTIKSPLAEHAAIAVSQRHVQIRRGAFDREGKRSRQTTEDAVRYVVERERALENVSTTAIASLPERIGEHNRVFVTTRFFRQQ
jgi:hypothetical protein